MVKKFTTGDTPYVEKFNKSYMWSILVRKEERC